MSTMERLLQLMAEKKASDLYVSANAPIQIRINGQSVPINRQVISAQDPAKLLGEIVDEPRMRELHERGELNLAIAREGLGSFRVSAFLQRGSVAVVVRYIPGEIPALDTLNLPPVLAELVKQRHGLILVVGSTGSGKSTTLASMLDHRNQQMSGHILTLEEPVEYLFHNRRSIVNQREIGIDARDLAIGLKNALRQAPDCIMIGEIRDRETMAAALSYALSGHLCLATLHASNSHQALNRILGLFPLDMRPALLSDLAAGLRAVISQRLLPARTGGRIPAVEVLLNTQLIRELIVKGDLGGVREAMEKSMAEGSQSFEQCLADMVQDGRVSREEALAAADSPTNLLWRLQNDFSARPAAQAAAPEADEPSFRDISLDLGA
ncbi:MAG: PilT/PilU family type 4a pilus ATPase [Betaproteobacteria bacterium]|nr:PilT/PilU family type 4a pilus ATPase [Betaproteobacteria bacterium]MBU6511549.1 PilT/PilU family type 4a pilus ATPase [Betaproteobacteria bacterium]MDE1954961.1 PilT/PilU family type 4a pilus ATPase [Betaproteobacteria bacterium]MDE2152892.1 PilT/PilU family type 4a pilus ATPase [Betaproteobacteria bacterium]MDE2478366.1 PilT/PilU family type 4a pilus ATPase [Betaproteobacteria bacterium]